MVCVGRMQIPQMSALQQRSQANAAATLGQAVCNGSSANPEPSLFCAGQAAARHMLALPSCLSSVCLSSHDPTAPSQDQAAAGLHGVLRHEAHTWRTGLLLRGEWGAAGGRAWSEDQVGEGVGWQCPARRGAQGEGPSMQANLLADSWPSSQAALSKATCSLSLFELCPQRPCAKCCVRPLHPARSVPLGRLSAPSSPVRLWRQGWRLSSRGQR